METLLVELRDGVVWVTMNRPHKKNAADPVMFDELRQVFVQAERDDADRALVLSGAEGNFCTGADLSAGTGLSADQPILTHMRRLSDLALALHRLTIPTLAKVDGLAVGAGLSLALGCDLVLASDRARFSAIFAKRALSLDVGASWLLPRAVGMAKAKEMALFGDMVAADEALAIGLVNKVVPVEQLDEEAAQWAGRLAAGPTLALSSTKALLNNAVRTSMDQALEDEARCQAYNFSTADTAEALSAFLEKRQPEFRGR